MNGQAVNNKKSIEISSNVKKKSTNKKFKRTSRFKTNNGTIREFDV